MVEAISNAELIFWIVALVVAWGAFFGLLIAGKVLWGDDE